MKDTINVNIDKLLRVVLAILLFVCLLDMPYGYYQVVRWAVAVAFAYWAYVAYEAKQIPVMIFCIGIVLLFQPIAKIALGREVWNVVDVLLGVGLLGSVIKLKDWG